MSCSDKSLKAEEVHAILTRATSDIKNERYESGDTSESCG